MAQFVWHDGSMKNIHVDMTQLYDYQKQLGAQVKLYESRIDWLSSSSRKIFGSVVEDKSVPRAPRFVAFTSLFNRPFTQSDPVKSVVPCECRQLVVMCVRSGYVVA